MKNYYFIKPEVAGIIDKSDFVDKYARPPKIEKLRYEFEVWLGDSILASILTYIVSDKLKNAIKRKKYTGVLFDEVEILISEEFKEFYPGKLLPKFYWLKIDGTAGKDDFGRDKELMDKRLVVSEAVLNVLREYGIDHAVIEDYNPLNI